MIVIDTSALMAILLKEPNRDACIDALEAESEVAISAGTLTEALIVAGSRGIETELRMLVRRLAFKVLPVTEAVAERVALAYARWGRGASPASLNFGDCFAYEAAASNDCPLLFVGQDFSRTDIRSALVRQQGVQEMSAGDLFGREEAEKTIERLFVGIMLSNEAAAAASSILDAAHGHGLRGSAIRRDRMHVTLVHIGDYLGAIPPSVIEAAGAVLAQVRSSAFEVVFDQSGSFSGAPGKHPFILLTRQPEAIATLRDEIWKGLLKRGLKTLSRDTFTPHVTLSYADRKTATETIAPVRWRVQDVLLIHSEVGRPTYRELDRIALA